MSELCTSVVYGWTILSAESILIVCCVLGFRVELEGGPHEINVPATNSSEMAITAVAARTLWPKFVECRVRLLAAQRKPVTICL